MAAYSAGPNKYSAIIPNLRVRSKICAHMAHKKSRPNQGRQTFCNPQLT